MSISARDDLAGLWSDELARHHLWHTLVSARIQVRSMSHAFVDHTRVAVLQELNRRPWIVPSSHLSCLPVELPAIRRRYTPFGASSILGERLEDSTHNLAIEHDIVALGPHGGHTVCVKPVHTCERAEAVPAHRVPRLRSRDEHL